MPDLEFHHQFYEPADLIVNYLPSFPGGGLFLATDTPFEMWTRFTLTFNLPAVDRIVTCLAEVLWVNLDTETGSGMGVRFVSMDLEERSLIEKFLKEYALRDDLLGGRYYRIFPLEEKAAESEPPADA